MFADQLRTAFLITWLVISTTTVPVQLAPFFFSPQRILAVAPKCDWKARYGRECILCGMTTSFLLISHGQLDAAVRRNKGSIPLYSALVWNECVAVWYALGQIRRMFKQPHRSRTQTEEFACKS